MFAGLDSIIVFDTVDNKALYLAHETTVSNTIMESKPANIFSDF
jgi:hypothetical protein